MADHPGDYPPPCKVVRVDTQRDFLTTNDEVVYIAVCSTGDEFVGDTTGAALLAHDQAHGELLNIGALGHGVVLGCHGCSTEVVLPPVKAPEGASGPWVSIENMDGWTAPPLLCPACSKAAHLGRKRLDQGEEGRVTDD